MRQPICLRCERGGLECLGYSHNLRAVARSEPPKVLKPRKILPKVQDVGNISLEQPANIVLVPEFNAEDNCSLRSSSGVEETDSRETLSARAPPPQPCYTGPGTLVQQKGRAVKPLTTGDYLKLFSPKPYKQRTTVSSPSVHQLILAFSRFPPSPSDPIIAYLSGPDFESYILSQFDHIMEHAYFKPMKAESGQLYGMVTSRLQSSHFSRWIILLSVKICETIIGRDQSQTELHMRWIGDVEVAVRGRLNQDPTPREAEELREDWLSISLLKSIFSRNSNAYVVLRNATPNFLQSVYSLPDLWSNTSDHTLIPLLNIIGSEHHALSSFTLLDSTCALSFGLPQQVEYDTRIGPLPKDFLPHEWAHGAPTEFQILLAEINACRDKSVGARDWREIEYVLVHWEAQAVQHDENWESQTIVAWLAVQESWRLALLAYLYLAVCGCPSGDERIQRSIKQTLQVVGTVKKHEDSEFDLPFFIQYLVVGICARSEKHRKITRNKLLELMTLGLDFVPVLDHLWHGAGSGGRAITWNDYVRSREALLPA